MAIEQLGYYVTHCGKVVRLGQRQRISVACGQPIRCTTCCQRKWNAFLPERLRYRRTIPIADGYVQDRPIERAVLDQRKSSCHRVGWTDGLAAQLCQPFLHHHRDERFVLEH